VAHALIVILTKALVTSVDCSLIKRARNVHNHAVMINTYPVSIAYSVINFGKIHQIVTQKIRSNL
jgi:hypothetical protein